MTGKVLFASHRPLARADNMKAIWDAMPSAQKSYAMMTTGRGYDEVVNVGLRGYSVLVCDEFPYYITNKGKCKLVMVGHGCDMGKTYGLDQPKPYVQYGVPEQIDYVISASEKSVQMICSGYGVPESKVLPLGYPASDYYFGKSRGDGGTPLSQVRSYLYVPTFRRGGIEGKMPATDWALVDSLLEDDEFVYVKPHMEVHSGLFSGKFWHIVLLDENVSSLPYVLDCSVLVSDYSSIVAEGYMAGRPCVLFAKDVERYLESRGMYMEYPRMYSDALCSDERSLVSAVRDAAGAGIGDAGARCLESMAGSCDGHSTERVVEFLKSLL